ncbi:hypothetical protein JCM8097_001711 [Rhodosporidiobolus ruineniae]
MDSSRTEEPSTTSEQGHTGTTTTSPTPSPSHRVQSSFAPSTAFMNSPAPTARLPPPARQPRPFVLPAPCEILPRDLLAEADLIKSRVAACEDDLGLLLRGQAGIEAVTDVLRDWVVDSMSTEATAEESNRAVGTLLEAVTPLLPPRRLTAQFTVALALRPTEEHYAEAASAVLAQGLYDVQARLQRAFTGRRGRRSDDGVRETVDAASYECYKRTEHAVVALALKTAQEEVLDRPSSRPRLFDVAAASVPPLSLA